MSVTEEGGMVSVLCHTENIDLKFADVFAPVAKEFLLS